MPRKRKPAPLEFDLTADEIEIFLEDVNECLAGMESGVLRLEQQSDPETLNAVFRATHTLKAVVGTVGHHQMAELAHTLETIFDEMREGRLTPNQVIVDQFLATIDALKTLHDEIVNRQASGVDVAGLLARLKALPQGDIEADWNPAPKTDLDLSQETAGSFGLLDAALTPEQTALLEQMRQAGQTLLEIEVAAAAESFAPAARLYQAGMALMEAGEIVAQRPPLDHLGEGDTQLWLILATMSPPGEIERLLADLSDVGEFHVKPLDAPAKPAAAPPEKSKSEGPTGQPKADKSSSQSEGTVRISIERLDSLMNLVGELVTDRTRLVQIEDILRVQYGKNGGIVGGLSELVPHFSHVVDQLQEEVMRARMLPIATLFNKFPRLVRDTARSAAKQVNLIIEGEATELDRAVIEAIGDPLIHLLRNAVDHGIESPQARQAAGKPAAGLVRLTAAPVEGQIVITVSDDGRGIDPRQIRQKALERGLLSEEEAGQFSNDEIIDLIFQPNLSTAAAVTEMSGRGVGLDVVRTNVERLSGSVVVTSEIGGGTTFQLTLPLTLALVQTMLVTVRNILYALPVTSINGAMYVAEAKISTVKGKAALNWQGAVLPVLDLRETFSHPHLAHVPANESKPSIVLVNWGKYRLGLVVDRIIGQQEIVVKTLSPLIGPVAGLSGATILGDGHIALIVDIPGLINAALQARRQVL